eukprot:scaffold353_cov185-Amphora_coffeaeformis.AAC.59
MGTIQEVETTEQNEFREVLSAQEQEEASTMKGEGAYMDVYVAHVTPRECGPLVKQLGKLPSQTGVSSLTDLSHLRRVRRRTMKDNVADGPPSAKKPNLELHVLLTAVRDVERILTTQPHLFFSVMDYLRQTYPLVSAGDVSITSVPARMAESETELREFDKSWPTVFFPNRTKEHLRRERLLTEAEVTQMKEGMKAALDDTLGAVIMDPTSGQLVSRAQTEDQEQPPPIGDHGEVSPTTKNPLSTPILLAIQGVSRRERQAACRIGMDNPAFHKGQYLCTGFDCYTVQEPTVFESMALVHARIRRLVFGMPRPSNATVPGGGILSQHQVHCLPNTNHKFRAFYCDPDSELGTLCKAHLKDNSKLKGESS